MSQVARTRIFWLMDEQCIAGRMCGEGFGGATTRANP